jgi:hypothetical protein
MRSGLDIHILATVELPTNLSLESMAGRVGAALGGFVFNREQTGLFEEVPAFVAQHCGMDFVLFGSPNEETGDAYVLEMSAATNLAIVEFRKSVPKIVGDFLCNKEADARGYVDYSMELASSLSAAGLKACEVNNA